MATEKSSTVNTKPNLTLVKPVSDFMDTAWSMETDLDVLNAMLCIGSSNEFHEFSEEVKVAYLHGCNRLSSQIKDNFQKLFELHRDEYERKASMQSEAAGA